MPENISNAQALLMLLGLLADLGAILFLIGWIVYAIYKHMARAFTGAPSRPVRPKHAARRKANGRSSDEDEDVWLAIHLADQHHDHYHGRH